jgi:hypothetical protein
MTSELTPGEIRRSLDDLKRNQGNFVTKELYKTELGHLSDDVSDLKEGQKWVIRLLAANFIGLIIIIATQGLSLP